MANSEHPGLLFWSGASEETRQEARAVLDTIVGDDVEELGGKFYSTFLVHDEASALLSHSVVSERLNLPSETGF